ncbi:metallophosphoesterase [Evansella sp. AB-rgal1]|uniref:metallophosphoesterase family protein n=1 Tax=Evansella sp. AB-rgal1 TaxID=3242696 RepID=UPI00359D2686
MKVDVVSDIHLDFWVTVKVDESLHRQAVSLFIEKIIPKQPSDILIIAGDMGHYNFQNALLLNELSHYYKYIFIVFGNHDFYMLNSNYFEKFEKDSMNRWNEMREIIDAIEGVYVLEGNKITVDNVVFGGTGGWYDFSFGQMYMHATLPRIKKAWYKLSNDSRLIKGEPTDVIKFSNCEKEKLFSIINECDFIVTHIPPLLPRLLNNQYNDISNSFYYMDIGDHKEKLSQKTWIFGHTHVRKDLVAYGCRFVNAPIGYPIEGEIEKKQIVTIEV